MDRYDSKELAHWTTGLFEACFVPRLDAEVAANVLVRTSLRGIDTHGLSRVPVYAEKLRSGEVNPQAQPHVQWRDGALHVDGDGGLGQVVACAAIHEAISRSEKLAAVSCVIRNSGHLSALGLFTVQAADHGRVALLCQKTPPMMALPGSRGPSIGNNPIAFAAPVPDGPPLVFDMATSVVARGQVMQALRDGAAIPDDWALGPDGAPTTDPALALKGSMRPIAGHKGVGLAMMVECLAGALTGALDIVEASPQGPVGSAGGISAFLLVINPELFAGKAAFEASMAQWLANYLGAAGPKARYPGQRQAQAEAERLALGIPLPESVLRELRATGESLGHPFALSPKGGPEPQESIHGKAS